MMDRLFLSVLRQTGSALGSDLWPFCRVQQSGIHQNRQQYKTSIETKGLVKDSLKTLPWERPSHNIIIIINVEKITTKRFGHGSWRFTVQSASQIKTWASQGLILLATCYAGGREWKSKRIQINLANVFYSSVPEAHTCRITGESWGVSYSTFIFHVPQWALRG